MAGTITHSWNGTILTITSDSGTSSADLKGSVGDIGPRGPQGPAGITIAADGTAQLEGYATETWVNDRILEVQTGDVNLDNYYTKAETNALIPDTSKFATTTYVDNAIAGVQGGGGSADLSNYYTKSEVDAKIPDVSGFATDADVAQAVSGLASETFVTSKIAEAQLGGEGGDIDLSGYATKDELNNYRRLDDDYFQSVKLTDGQNVMLRMNAWGIGSDTNNTLWISSDGTGAFATSLTLDGKPVATQEYVTQAVNDALAALDGDEVTY